MISIDIVYKTFLTLGNIDIRGNTTPADARYIINDVVNEIYEEYFPDHSKLQNRANKGLSGQDFASLVDLHGEKISYFLSPATTLTFSTPFFALPTNARYIDACYYNNARIEFCKTSKDFRIIQQNRYAAPTINDPIALRTGNNIQVLPATIQSNVTCYYYRKPLIANWTYTVVDGAEVFNPSASGFQDIDLHPSEENNVILKCLSRVGVNLKEADLQNYAMNKEQIKTNSELTV